MAFTYREGLGRPLEYEELDDNFEYVEALAQSSEQHADQVAQDTAITRQARDEAVQSAADLGVAVQTATEEASKAKASADTAAAVVTGGTASLTPAPGKIPLADGEGKISPDWISLSTSGKAVATGTPAQGRTALGLGSAALRDVVANSTDLTPGRMLVNGSQVLSGGLAGSDNTVGVKFTGYRYSTQGVQVGSTGAAPVLQVLASRSFTLSARGNNVRVVTYGNTNNDTTDTVMDLHHTGNATVDSNGFIKKASPILKLHSDRIETEIEAPHFERIDTGHYQLSNTNGLRLDDGWYIETPHDRNGNKYFNVEWEQDHTPTTEAGVLGEHAGVSLSIRCYERVWNPQTGTYDNGDPVDIPDGRWIDLRMNEVRQPEPEMPEDAEAPQQPSGPGAPIVPHVVTKAQGKTALIQTGLWQAVVDYVAAIEDETERMLAEVALHDAQDYRRDSPFLNAAADALGITEEQKDDLFILASSIVL